MLGTQIIVDSDALIGLIHQDDILHKQCLKISQYLTNNNFQIIIPYPILLEASTALNRSKLIKGPYLARKLLKDYARLEKNYLKQTNVSSLIAKLYNPKTAKKNTPFDYYLLALAKKNNIKVIFSFDSFYRKNGLILAKSLLKKG